MPSYISHNLLKEQLGLESTFAHNYGVQGGDILFHNAHNINYIGTRFHRQCVYKTLYTIKNYAYESGERELIEYFKAYLCHYALDSILHPYVYACEKLYAEQVDKTLEAYPIHMRIEANIDELLLEKLRKKTVYDIEPRELFKSDAQLKEKISKMFCFAAEKVFGEKIDGRQVEISFDMYADSAAYTKCPSEKERQELIKSGKLAHPDFIELCQPCPARDDFDYMNEKKRFWVHPDTDEKLNWSVAEMFDRAVWRAKELILLFENVQSEEQAKRLTNNINFCGNMEE